MSQINILVIGNSFSEDTTHYVHQICENAGVFVKVVNLYIPGCSLKQHWENIVNRNQVYRYELNGYYDLDDPEEKWVDIESILREEEWDHIVSQQASHDSGLLQTYHPYAKKIYHYLKRQKPQAKLWIQQTWAYETDSDHDQFHLYHNDQKTMYRELTACYEKVARELNVPLIKTGEVIQRLRTEPEFDYENDGISLCRDGFHLSYIYGRYLASLVWCQMLLEIDVLKNEYLPKTRFTPNFQVDRQKINLIKETVLKVKS